MYGYGSVGCQHPDFNCAISNRISVICIHKRIRCGRDTVEANPITLQVQVLPRTWYPSFHQVIVIMEEIQSRHKKELKVLDGEKRSTIKKAKALKGQRGKEALARCAAFRFGHVSL